MTTKKGASAEIYWLPLGAGGHVVKHVGRAYERIRAAQTHRAPVALFHTALIVQVPAGTYVIEQVPAGDIDPDRGVVCVGPVGLRWPSRWHFPHYEVHCWPNGVIVDQGEAVESPMRISTDDGICQRMLSCLPDLPVPVWGRDELATGEMWNSNSVTSWVLSRSGIDPSTVVPPKGGRAPGWAAGIIAERRLHTVPLH